MRIKSVRLYIHILIDQYLIFPALNEIQCKVYIDDSNYRNPYLSNRQITIEQSEYNGWDNGNGIFIALQLSHYTTLQSIAAWILMWIIISFHIRQLTVISIPRYVLHAIRRNFLSGYDFMKISVIQGEFTICISILTHSLPLTWIRVVLDSLSDYR